jgi:hypothetical protein
MLMLKYKSNTSIGGKKSHLILHLLSAFLQKENTFSVHTVKKWECYPKLIYGNKKYN